MEDKCVEVLEKIRGDLAIMKDDMADIKEDLALHIYRTGLAEESIKILRKEFKPVEDHVKFVQQSLKFGLIILGACGTIATIGAALYAVIK